MSTNLNLTDMETCYKAFRREVLDSIELREDRFGFEAEVTAKVARGGWRIYEVGVSYSGRTYAQGKKIGWRDGFKALYCIVRYSPLWASFGGSHGEATPGRLVAPGGHEPHGDDSGGFGVDLGPDGAGGVDSASPGGPSGGPSAAMDARHSGSAARHRLPSRRPGPPPRRSARPE